MTNVLEDVLAVNWNKMPEEKYVSHQKNIFINKEVIIGVLLNKQHLWNQLQLIEKWTGPINNKNLVVQKNIFIYEKEDILYNYKIITLKLNIY